MSLPLLNVVAMKTHEMCNIQMELQPAVALGVTLSDCVYQLVCGTSVQHKGLVLRSK